MQGEFNALPVPAQNLDYDYEFIIDDDDLLFPIPINRTGQADWQVLANNTKVMLIEDQETVIYDVRSTSRIVRCGLSNSVHDFRTEHQRRYRHPVYTERAEPDSALSVLVVGFSQF